MADWISIQVLLVINQISVGGIMDTMEIVQAHKQFLLSLSS
jgi:hypothetical protein